MAIPTLRGLGLLMGFEATVHLSSDGALVAAGFDRRRNDPMAAVLGDIEAELGLDTPWSPVQTIDEISAALFEVDAEGTSESRRRVQRWLAYLEYFGVVARTGEGREGLCRTSRPALQVSAPQFEKYLLAAYRKLSPKTIGEPAVLIDDVAREVALQCLDAGEVVTRRMFDGYLSRCVSDGRVAVHLHRSMGAGQKLFRLRGEVFESMSIRRN